jgi:hypothetical protein
VRGKVVDYITHSVDNATVYFTVWFAHGPTSATAESEPKRCPHSTHRYLTKLTGGPVFHFL